MKDIIGICEDTVQRALDGGADEAEAFASSGKDVDVQLQKNDIQMAKSASGDGIGVRVFRNGSLGFAFVNSFDENELNESVERALGIAAASPSDRWNGLPEPTPVEPLDGLYDDRASSYGVDEAVEQAITMMRSAKERDRRVTIDGGGLTCSWSTKAVVSSRGVRAVEKGSVFYCFIMGMAVDGDNISSFDFQFDCSRSAGGYDPRKLGEVFADNVIASLGAVKGESFKGSVLLAPKAAAEIVAYPVQYALSASSVQKDTSRFAGKLNTNVASPLVTMIDDASLHDGFASTAFDREGIAPETLPLIEEGVLRNYLYDGYTARKDGRPSNGHAGGGASSVPTVANTNFVMSAGTSSLQEMISGIDRGILVTRYSGNVDPVSGDFSGSVKGGRMIRSGKIAEPVSGTMIAGNSFELLQSISAVSVERETLFGDCLPHVRMDGVVVTSG